MQESLLELICCPACQQSLTVQSHTVKEPEIWEGTLHCPHCHATYPIHNGLPLLYVNNEKWQPKAIEAAGWVTYHKDLGIYDIGENPTDLKIPYCSKEPWIQVAQSFDIALQELNLTGNELILDLGAGRGWAAKHFALLGCRVVALDVVPDMNIGLGRSRALMDDAGVYFDRIIGDGENLPFFPGHFDLIFCSAALHHSSHLDILLQNASQALKSGGRLIAINEPCRSIFEDEQEILDHSASHELEVGINETRPDLAEYEEAFTQAGLAIIKAFPITTYNMDIEDLRSWVTFLRNTRPSFRQRPLRQQLLGWVRYTLFRFHSRVKPFFINKNTTQNERANLEKAILNWVSSAIIILAKKET